MGSFDWLAKIGATPAAVATVNDQPILIITLIVVILALGLQVGIVVATHFLTRKPEQKQLKADKKKDSQPNEKDAKPAQAQMSK